MGPLLLAALAVCAATGPTDSVTDDESVRRDSVYRIEVQVEKGAHGGGVLEEISEAVEEAMEDAAEAVEERNEGHEPRGGAFTVQWHYLDRRLLEDLQGFVGADWDIPPDTRDRSALMIGGMNYRILPADIRLGSGLWVGYKGLRSAAYYTQTVDTVTGDTTTRHQATTLQVIPVHIGGVFEKAFEVGPVSFAGGFMCGGGALVAIKNVKPADEVFAGADSAACDDGWEGHEEVEVAIAPQIVGDIHVGVWVRVAPALRIGVDGQVMVSYAPGGFVTGAAVCDFYTVSPGVRLRIQWERRT